VFKDSYASLSLVVDYYECLSLSAEGRYSLIVQSMDILDSSTNKGFLTSSDLSKFPIISELLSSFIIDGCEEFIKGDCSMESYK
jgi:hypothetical protein